HPIFPYMGPARGRCLGPSRPGEPVPFIARLVGPMDTSHIAQHAGTTAALFASVFVVATTTMRTMIPLRVFGILTNLVLIATAIPAHNYLVIGVQTVVLGLNAYRLHQMLQLVRDLR